MFGDSRAIRAHERPKVRRNSEHTDVATPYYAESTTDSGHKFGLPGEKKRSTNYAAWEGTNGSEGTTKTDSHSDRPSRSFSSLRHSTQAAAARSRAESAVGSQSGLNPARD